MKLLFYDIKPYEREAFMAVAKNYPQLKLDFLEAEITVITADLARGYGAVCLFVAAEVNAAVLAALKAAGVQLILLRCAGYNHVDIAAAKRLALTVLRVPGYAPEAIAEHAMALAFAVNRRLHKAYIKVRENNFSLMGLTGLNFYKKTAGIVGTGKIGSAMCRICKGLGMHVLAYDKKQAEDLPFVQYTSLEFLLRQSDLISLHCPLTPETYHLIDLAAIQKMKNNVILVNTSRGALISTNDLIKGIRQHKFFGVGLDVYEEEQENVFENREDDILETSVTARLLSFPNVIVTSHQGFLTKEALEAISKTTLQNAADFLTQTVPPENRVC